MGATNVNDKERLGEEHEAPLKGTWISVGVVGAVILATYIVLIGFYMVRV